MLNYPRVHAVHVNGFFLSRNGNTWPKGPQFNGARRKPRQLSGCSSHSAIKLIFGYIWNTPNIPQHPPTSPNMQCSYMILHVRMTKWCQKITWFAPIRSEMLTPMLAVANSIWRPWAAPHRAQWSKSPAETPVTAGALPHFGVCIWVMSGNSMIYRMMYMFVLGVRSYKRVWRILEDGDP